MLKGEKYDTGLSRNEERFSLVFAILMNLSQIRGLLYYRLLKIMVIVGHNDIECCFLMPNDKSETTGVLADDYYKSLIKEHSSKIARRRQKMIHYLQDSFHVFQESCEKLLNMGVMERLFHDFDFFSMQHRDVYGNRQSAPPPKVVKVKTNHFAEAEYEFSSDFSSDSESSADEKPAVNTDKLDDYEVFLNGFFYFFILQDPFIRNYLNLHYEPTNAQQEDILSDLKFFQENYMLQWVQIMVNLEIFQSTSHF